MHVRRVFGYVAIAPVVPCRGVLKLGEVGILPGGRCAELEGPRRPDLSDVLHDLFVLCHDHRNRCLEVLKLRRSEVTVISDCANYWIREQNQPSRYQES